MTGGALDDPQSLVSTGWLAERLPDADLRILDGSYHLPAAGRDPKREYYDGHIPGARFFDIDAISDPRSDLPHMAPEPEMFISRMRAMGVGDGNQVVVYDSVGLFSAARIWWLFRLMGKDQVAVLDGGLPKWIAGGHPLDEAPPPMRDRHITTARRPELLADVTAVALASKLGDRQIVDARSPSRFAGAEPEPRAGLRAGHIPGSVNVHYASLLDRDGTMKPVDQLRAIFVASGVDTARPIITTCGSGITAAILSLALHRLGARDVALYDGSWSEWGAHETLEVATG